MVLAGSLKEWPPPPPVHLNDMLIMPLYSSHIVTHSQKKGQPSILCSPSFIGHGSFQEFLTWNNYIKIIKINFRKCFLNYILRLHPYILYYSLTVPLYNSITISLHTLWLYHYVTPWLYPYTTAWPYTPLHY